ncbi:hypothetical protein UVI_02006990 [Ustilaginoidea virens]|uniref:UDENN domain-containing protein n=1 Tax=Ustilaginoidea virens TaxID=1159556 RepID=A0A1B5KW13_USTVR|nr:hypothetical protein UVI_02006990 [Ustilaginoidea virens]
MAADGASSPYDGGDPMAMTAVPLTGSDSPANKGFSPLVTVVGFHHARGPEVETWFGADQGIDPAMQYNWPLLPFMALSDGAHASEEEFSYFTLLKPKTNAEPATSLFGISCTRQLDSSHLITRPADVTRSTVQKAVVVIADSPQHFGMLRERLSIVTQAWFAQREFTDTDILRRFQESLADTRARGITGQESERDLHLGMSLRELIHEFKWQALVLLKCCLLQPKFSLISLIPGLIRNLQDCADPELNSYEEKLAQPTSLQSSNRNSLLTFMGLPLQIFGKGGFFGPYTPLQQLDILADFGTKSYIVGSTNSLLLQQKDRYSDILINLDEDTVNITSPSLKAALALTPADRRWIDFLTHEVNETWDDADPSRPKNMQYVGSEEFIRSQFEAYILGLISSVKYHNFLVNQGEGSGPSSTLAADADPADDFGHEWVEAWSRTENYRMWNAHTDTNLFAVSEPKHPCAGGLTIEDIQRRVADQFKDLHLDERLAQGRDILGRNLAAGREKASSMLGKLYSDMEYLRESQRRRAEEARAQPGPMPPPPEKGPLYPVDLAKAQQTVHSASAKASAYMSSWATWAGEKRKSRGGWGVAGWGKKSGAALSPSPSTPIDREYQVVSAPGSRPASTEHHGPGRPAKHASFSESILSAASDGRVSGSSEPDHDTFHDVGGTPARSAADGAHAPKAQDDGFQTAATTGGGASAGSAKGPGGQAVEGEAEASPLPKPGRGVGDGTDQKPDGMAGRPPKPGREARDGTDHQPDGMAGRPSAQEVGDE